MIKLSVRISSSRYTSHDINSLKSDVDKRGENWKAEMFNYTFDVFDHDRLFHKSTVPGNLVLTHCKHGWKITINKLGARLHEVPILQFPFAFVTAKRIIARREKLWKNI